MKDCHVQTGQADQNDLGVEIAVLQILGGVGNEEQAAGGNGDSKRAPGPRQNSAGDAAHTPVNRGEPKQSQIDHENETDHQANREYVDRVNKSKQQIVLANIDCISGIL